MRIYLPLLILLLICSSAMAQSLQSLENSYLDVQSKISREYKILDSLNNVLIKRGRQIDDEKRREEPDENLLVQLMASSASVSNNIDAHKTKLKELTKKNESIAIQLTGRYNSIIDSLKELPHSGLGDKNELDSEILLITEKRLLVEPGIQNLSFKPEKILKVDASKITDKKERAAYTDYLVSALNEVESVLSGINNKTVKVEEIIVLQKKTEKFLKEMEFEGRPNTRRYSLNSSLETQATRGSYDVLNPLVGNEALNSQVKAYNVLLDQLTFDKSISSDIKWDFTFHPDKNYSLNDYRDLLKEVKKNLSEYKNILRNKLASLD